MKIANAAGKVFFGLHFVPGVAEYQEPEGGGSFRVFVGEDVIRQMNPSFAGCPVFVEHVGDVTSNREKLRAEADGWVTRSFYNAADGKTWCEFIVVTDRGLAAIGRGWRLSNAYVPRLAARESLWNGVSYQKEVLGGEFEHLAIVENPRYEESVVMTPEEFKSYNAEKTSELTRLANSNEKKGEPKMKLNLFKRAKVENALDLEGTLVELPKSKKEMSLVSVVNAYDAILNMNGYANGDHMVKVGDKEEMSVNDLVKKHLEACNELEELKKKNEGDDEDEGGEPGVDNEGIDDDGVADRGGDRSEGGKNPKQLDKFVSNEEKDEKDEKVKNAKRAKALALKNARDAAEDLEEVRVDLAMDQVARGKARYGSGN